jgi:Tfp pilus assembly protein PilO
MKEILLIGAIGVAISLPLGYNMIYLPQQVQVLSLRQQIAAEQAKQRTDGEVALLLQQLQQYRDRLPKEPDPSWLVREIVPLAEKAGVQLTTIRQEVPQEAEEYTRLTVTLQFTAPYHRLGVFLDDVERSERFIRVERVRVSKGKEGEPPKVDVTLETFYLAPLVPGIGNTGST